MNDEIVNRELEVSQRTVRFFENVLRASNDGIVITDFAQNIIVANEAFCAAVGQNMHDVIESSLYVWLEQFDNDAPLRWAELERFVQSEGACRNIEFRITAPETRYFNINASLLERTGIEEAGVIISIWRDVTELKLAEEELKKHRENLEELVRERTKELEEKNKDLKEYNKLFVDREFRIKELRDRVEELEK